MRFHFPPASTAPTIQQRFDRHFEEVEYKRFVKRIIREQVRDIHRERLSPRLRSLEQQQRELEREYALAQADEDSKAWFQAKIDRAAGEIAEIQAAIEE